MKKSIKNTGIAILVLLAIMGIWTLGIRLQEGMKVTNLNSISWGLWVSLYIYCIGLSAGSFLLSTMIYVFGMHQFEKMGRMSLLSALIALIAGLLFVWIDLGHPWRFYKIFTGWQSSSVLAWESMLYLSYIVIILLELWLVTRNDFYLLYHKNTGFKKKIYKFLSLGWKRKETIEERVADYARKMKWVKILGIIGLPNAIGVHGGTGALFAVVAAKPYWFSGLFPIIFLVSALVSGCGLMLMLYSFWGKKDEDHQNIVFGLRNFLLMFIGIDVILLASDLLINFYGGIPDHVNILNNIMFGRYWYVFWLGQIGLAWLLPILIGSMSATKNKVNWLGFAGLCTVVGIVCVRFNLVMPAYTEHQLPGLDKSFEGFTRLSYSYFPSGIEWMTSIGLWALLVLIFIAMWKIVPLFDIDKDPVHFKVLQELEERNENG